MIEPIKVIIQDFPLFLSEYFNMKLFAITTKAHNKEKTWVHSLEAKISPMAIKLRGIKDKLIILQKTKLSSTLFAIKSNVTTKLAQYSSILTQFKLDIYNDINKVKIIQKTNGKINIHDNIYAIKDRVSVGVPLTLGYWDGAVNENFLKKFDSSELFTLDPQKLIALDGKETNTLLGTMDLLTIQQCSILIVD